jgi:hypothetical protein
MDGGTAVPPHPAITRQLLAALRVSSRHCTSGYVPRRPAGGVDPFPGRCRSACSPASTIRARPWRGRVWGPHPRPVSREPFPSRRNSMHPGARRLALVIVLSALVGRRQRLRATPVPVDRRGLRRRYLQRVRQRHGRLPVAALPQPQHHGGGLGGFRREHPPHPGRRDGDGHRLRRRRLPRLQRHGGVQRPVVRRHPRRRLPLRRRLAAGGAEGSGIATYEDLAGKRIALGSAGSGTHLSIERLLRQTGMFDRITPVFVAGQAASDQLKDGQVDGYHALLGVPNATLVDTTTARDAVVCRPTRWRSRPASSRSTPSTRA